MLGDPNNVTLTERMALDSGKASNIEDITKLYFYHENISDIAIIEYMPKLEIAYFTSNKITTLKPFAKLQNLRELYIRYNKISTFDELKHLQNLKNLRILWMLNNPIAEQPSYRELVIKLLPQIVKLDDIEISDAERRFVSLANPEVHKPVEKKSAGLINKPMSFADDLLDEPIPPKRKLQQKVTSQPLNTSISKSGKSSSLHSSSRLLSTSSKKVISPPKPEPEPEEDDDKNLLTAVLTLLPELSTESLEIVLHKIRELTK